MRSMSVMVVTSMLGVAGGQTIAPRYADRCKSLVRTDFSQIPDAPTQITEATPMAAEPSLPGYCRVTGYVTPAVGFELRLPQNWNGKLLELGCAGQCGVRLPSACDGSLSKGYACIVSDMGHTGSGHDSLWARDNLQAKIDWGYRATHVAALAGKALTEKFYSRKPDKAYFIGCSTGGRQGLQEAQRFPWDFDGIIAGAPPIRLADLYVTFAWGQRVTHDGQGTQLLHAADLKLLNEAALAKCDLDDGVKDGIISEPLHCSFRPSEIACRHDTHTGCLGPAQLKAAEQIYSGPTDAQGNPLFGGGALPGSENDWEKYYLDPGGQKSYLYGLTEEAFRHLFFSPDPGSHWTLNDFDFDQDLRRLDVMQSLYESGNPDLSRFMRVGGKMIIYIGMNDISLPRSVIDYYEKVERVTGGRRATQKFVRLFALPGVEHCSGGPGADHVDYLGYLENWVEHGEPPDKLIAYHLTMTGNTRLQTFPPPKEMIEFSRPLYPYPTTDKYLGRGNIRDADSFGRDEQ